uniref:Uncharacterized protein n=1 Tax=Rangifer tarandus platyrhynchus TaxID=3082113 RepID=A0ACB0EVW8_RANTA|nr:unnamed protein product [Rangifer tarandus platyrhynchus]
MASERILCPLQMCAEPPFTAQGGRGGRKPGCPAAAFPDTVDGVRRVRARLPSPGSGAFRRDCGRRGRVEVTTASPPATRAGGSGKGPEPGDWGRGRARGGGAGLGGGPGPGGGAELGGGAGALRVAAAGAGEVHRRFRRPRGSPGTGARGSPW